jgi:hypothetical protein
VSPASPTLLGTVVTFSTSETAAVTISPLSSPPGASVGSGTVNGGQIFTFCVGPNGDNCMSSGLYGSVTIAANTVNFTFYGSTFPATGTFAITISGFSSLNSVTLAPNTGSLQLGSFGVTNTANSMMFTGTTSSGFASNPGVPITFNVT